MKMLQEPKICIVQIIKMLYIIFNYGNENVMSVYFAIFLSNESCTLSKNMPQITD